MPIIGEVILKYVLAPLLIGIACLVAGYHFGCKVTEADFLRSELADAKKADTKNEKAQTSDAVSAAAETVRENTVREITREVPTIVDRPVYHNVCLDADGVQLITRAVGAANGGQAPSGPADLTAPVQPAAPVDGQLGSPAGHR